LESKLSESSVKKGVLKMGRQKLPEDLKKERWRRYMRDYMKAYRKRQKDLKMFSDVVDKYSAVPRSTSAAKRG
jgi:rhamnogalacturonyl hydrolase YesR